MKPALKLTFITGGVMTVVGPMLGVLGSVLGMVGSFRTLGGGGIANPDDLASNISVSLYSTAIGMTIGGVGFLVLIVGLVCWLYTRNTSGQPGLPGGRV